MVLRRNYGCVHKYLYSFYENYKICAPRYSILDHWSGWFCCRSSKQKTAVRKLFSNSSRYVCTLHVMRWIIDLTFHFNELNEAARKLHRLVLMSSNSFTLMIQDNADRCINIYYLCVPQIGAGSRRYSLNCQRPLAPAAMVRIWPKSVV